MLGHDGRINVAILAVPEVTASTLYGMFDLFSSPGRDFAFITAGVAGAQRMRPYVVARRTEPFQAANGIWITRTLISPIALGRTSFASQIFLSILAKASLEATFRKRHGCIQSTATERRWPAHAPEACCLARRVC